MNLVAIITVFMVNLYGPVYPPIWSINSIDGGVVDVQTLNLPTNERFLLYVDDDRVVAQTKLDLVKGTCKKEVMI